MVQRSSIMKPLQFQIQAALQKTRMSLSSLIQFNVDSVQFNNSVDVVKLNYKSTSMSAISSSIEDTECHYPAQ